MKTILYTSFLFLVSQLISSQAMARKVENLTAYGYASAYCQGDAFAQMCFRQVEDQAEYSAKRDLEIQCRIKNGRLSYFGFCSKYCTPAHVPPGQAFFVNCNARCNYDCEISEN